MNLPALTTRTCWRNSGEVCRDAGDEPIAVRVRRFRFKRKRVSPILVTGFAKQRLGGVTNARREVIRRAFFFPHLRGTL